MLRSSPTRLCADRLTAHPKALPAVLKVLHSKNGAVVEATTYALINLSINCGAIPIVFIVQPNCRPSYLRCVEKNAAAWSPLVGDILRRLIVLLQHERRDVKFNVLRVLLNFCNDRTPSRPCESARMLTPPMLATLRPAISDAQPYGFFKTLMLGNDEEILYKVAQILGNLSDRSGTRHPPTRAE